MLELKGLTDRRGKLRTAWIQMLSTLIEKARGLDVTLGLERKHKKVETLAIQSARDAATGEGRRGAGGRRKSQTTHAAAVGQDSPATDSDKVTYEPSNGYQPATVLD
jgi:hypothetical protein